MNELINFVQYVLHLYVYVLFASVIYSWLIAFNVINPYNQFVRSIGQALHAATEPFLRPIRRLLPDLGGLDISPIFLVLAIIFIQTVVLENLRKLVA